MVFLCVKILLFYLLKMFGRRQIRISPLLKNVDSGLVVLLISGAKLNI